MKKRKSGTAAGRKTPGELMLQSTGPAPQHTPKTVGGLMKQGDSPTHPATGTMKVKEMMRQ